MIRLTCQCGEIYYSDRQHIGKQILCKKCLNIIDVQENVPTLAGQSTRQVAEQAPVSNKTSRPINIRTLFRRYFKAGIFVAIAIVAAVVAFNFVSMSTSRQNSYPLAHPAQKDTNAVKPEIIDPYDKNTASQQSAVEPTNPRHIPLGSSPFGTGIRSGRSSLTIDNGTETDAVVRVDRPGSTKLRAIRNFGIPNGQQFTAKQLPPGNYILRVAFGRDWDSDKKRFNFRRSFGESESFNITESEWNEPVDDGTIHHTQATKMSITLHKVLYGNFKSHEISEEDFLK